ncbi:MAG: hypothetical protein OXE99_06075 [Cellvibrionales bacterium]|nr:hypothetical protein [Cellvibrionales bacterium]
MKKTIKQIDQCEKCGKEKEYLIRSENTRTHFGDDDIMKIISEKANKPYRFKHCDNCKMATLTKTIAYSGTS